MPTPFHLPPAGVCWRVEADAALPSLIVASVNISGGDGDTYSFTITGSVTATRSPREVDPADLGENTFALEREACPSCVPAVYLQNRVVDDLTLGHIAAGTVTLIDVYDGDPVETILDAALHLTITGETVEIILGSFGASIDATKTLTGLNPKTLAGMIGTHTVTGPGVGHPPGITSTETFTYVVS